METKYSYENNGETYMKLTIPINMKDHVFTLYGYSRAGHMTSIMVDHINIVFDMGYANKRACSCDVLISHGHMDHIGCLHTDHSVRKLFNINKEKLYIMPQQCIQPFMMIAAAFSEMNCGRNGTMIKPLYKLVNTNIIASQNCINIPLSGNLNHMVTAYMMDHKVESYGYIIKRMTNRLKPEYINMSQQEIIKVKSKVGAMNLTEPFYTNMIGYTGDTTIEGVLHNNEFLNVPLLIMECTGFSEDDIIETTQGKHIHINDIIINLDKFNNMKIVLFHASQKYKKLEDIQDYIKNLPDKFVYFL
jgi:ribonuclease BN (tRNA processing enzyme)